MAHRARFWWAQTKLIKPAIGEAFATLIQWADDIRDIGIRVNADTVEDVETAQQFGVDGIGLCRTEHMFFDPSRLTLMREMIFAETESDRAAALGSVVADAAQGFHGVV